MLAPMSGTLIGTTEAAKRCGVERTTFFRWVQQGRIKPRTKLEGRTGALLFDPDEVQELIEETARRAKYGACPECPWASWGPCEHREAAS